MFGKDKSMEKCYSYMVVTDPSGSTIKRYDGWPPIHIAAYEGDYEKLVNELNRGVDVNTVADNLKSRGAFSGKFNWRWDTKLITYFNNVTPLYTASSSGNEKCVKILMERGADPTIKAINTNCNSSATSYSVAMICNNFKSARAIKKVKPKVSLLGDVETKRDKM
jgi:ankyrin repeat protein